MKNDKLIQQFLDTLEKDNQKINYKSALKKYLEWRKITPKELITNGLKEETYFKDYTKELGSIGYKQNTLLSRIGMIKKFLRFHGVPFKRYEFKRKGYYFADDKYMKQFLILSGNTEGTKKNNNYFLASYCQFRSKTPTELIDEIDSLHDTDLRVVLKEFYDSMTFKTKGNYLSGVLRFYTLVGNRTVIMPSNTKTKVKRKHRFDRKQITKDLVKQLLEGSDLRDSMIIITSFEGGLNPVDLVSLNYGQLKDYLNLEEPDSIIDVAVIPHVRQKTGNDFLACFGVQSLRYISKWLKFRLKNMEQWDQKLTNDTPIFSMKKVPYERLKPINIKNTLMSCCERIGLDYYLTSADFRNSFNTRAKQMLKHYDKELFMGHSGGIERHYDVSDIEYFRDEYRKAWKILFDLSYNNETVQTLEEENKEIKSALRDVSGVLENLYLALTDSEGKSTLSKKDLEQALSKVRNIR